MLSKSIYVSSITNLSDARYCAGMEVEFLGICLDADSENHIPLATFKEIKNWLVGVKWIGETSNTNIEEVKELLVSYDINYIKTNSLSFSEELHFYSIATFTEINKIDEIADTDNNLFILNDFGINELSKISPSLLSKVYINGAYSIAELEQIREIEHLKGVILTGGVEIRPGFKNMDEIIDAIEVFEIE